MASSSSSGVASSSSSAAGISQEDEATIAELIQGNHAVLTNPRQVMELKLKILPLPGARLGTGRRIGLIVLIGPMASGKCRLIEHMILHGIDPSTIGVDTDPDQNLVRPYFRTCVVTGNEEGNRGAAANRNLPEYFIRKLNAFNRWDEQWEPHQDTLYLCTHMTNLGKRKEFYDAIYRAGFRLVLILDTNAGPATLTSTEAKAGLSMVVGLHGDIQTHYSNPVTFTGRWVSEFTEIEPVTDHEIQEQAGRGLKIAYRRYTNFARIANPTFFSQAINSAVIAYRNLVNKHAGDKASSERYTRVAEAIEDHGLQLVQSLSPFPAADVVAEDVDFLGRVNDFFHRLFKAADDVQRPKGREEGAAKKRGSSPSSSGGASSSKKRQSSR